MNNATIARAIATTVLNSVAPFAPLFVEDVIGSQTPYEGVLIAHEGNMNRCVHVYLCDDEPGSELWMIDATNTFTGEVDPNPKPLTAKGIEDAINWLLAEVAAAATL